MAHNDILIPAHSEPADSRHGRIRAAAFVPITLAVIGVVAILFGGISARHADSAALQAVDPIETGSLAR